MVSAIREGVLDSDADSDSTSTHSSTASPDCAVGLFSDIFFLPCRRACRPIVLGISADSERVTMKTESIVASFPAEILLIIFKFVHLEERYKFDDNTSEEDILSPSLFPYSIAAVCPYWRGVMALVPEFWTRVVTLVDQHPTPPPAVECQLAWSRDLPIDVVVTRRIDTYTTEDKDESVRTHRVVTRLLPHLHRFRHLSFHVMLSSSLPSFPRDFKGLAPLLRCLELECTEDDGGAAPVDAQNEATTFTTLDTQTEDHIFQCPALRELTIDGRNYYNTGRMGPSWSAMLSNIQTLTVSHFKPKDGKKLSICDLIIPLNAIRRLRNLTIANLSIDISESPLASYDVMNNAYLPYLETIDVRDLECISPDEPDRSEPLDTLLFIVGRRLKSTRITRCMTAYVQDFFGHLHLEGITKYNIWQLLQCWYGKVLRVSHCPVFTDDTLEDMAYEYAWRPSARNLDTLYISDCRNISAAGLKRFVRGRRKTTGAVPLSPLKKLFVSGNSPYIPSNDQFWFTKKLHQFSYRSEELESDSSASAESDGPGSDSDDSDV